MVVVANIALAHQQAWQIFERVFAVGGVDGLLDLLTRDPFDGGRNLSRQGSRLTAGDGHHAERFNRRFARGRCSIAWQVLGESVLR